MSVLNPEVSTVGYLRYGRTRTPSASRDETCATYDENLRESPPPPKKKVVKRNTSAIPYIHPAIWWKNLELHATYIQQYALNPPNYHCVFKQIFAINLYSATPTVTYIPVRYVQLCIADIRQAILNSSDYSFLSSI